jgi:hypothetical protein
LYGIIGAWPQGSVNVTTAALSLPEFLPTALIDISRVWLVVLVNNPHQEISSDQKTQVLVGIFPTQDEANRFVSLHPEREFFVGMDKPSLVFDVLEATVPFLSIINIGKYLTRRE